MKILDHRAGFRLQVGQLVIYRRLGADSKTRNIVSCCVTCCSLLFSYEERYYCII